MKKQILFFAFAILIFCLGITGVSGVTTTPDLPDLRVYSITVTPSSPIVDEQVTIQVVHKNYGSEFAGENYNVNFSFGQFDGWFEFENDGFAVTDRPYPSPSSPLGHHETFTETYTGYFKKVGSKTLIVSIDNMDQIEESDDSNNALSKVVNIKANQDEKPDLVISDLYESGGNLRVQYENIGEGYSQENFKVTCSGDSSFEEIINKGAWMSPGEKRYIEKYIGSGTFELACEIDRLDIIDEENEGNNNYEETVVIGIDSNLIISNVEAPDAYIRPTTAKIKWTTNHPSNSDVHYWSVDGIQNNYNWDKIDDYTQTSHVIELKDLKPFTTYKFTVSGQKVAGEVKTTSGEYTFTTTYEDSKDKVVIEDINEIVIDKNTVSIVWLSNSDYTMENMCNLVYGDNKDLKDDEVKVSNSKPKVYGSSLYYYSVYVQKDNFYYKIKCNIGDSIDESDIYYYNKLNDDDSDNRDCITLYTPVCGVDGKTYSNRCVAEVQNNVKVSYDGECIIDSNNDDSSSDDFENSSANRLVLKLQRRIGQLERQVINLEKKLTKLDAKFAEKYAGTMFLDVENDGRLWYVDPESKNRFYFENGASALSIGSKLALGITYENLMKIPVGVPDKLYNLKDTDGDGLPDRLESALGSDPEKTDTDGDGYDDKTELLNSYSPIDGAKYSYNQSLIDRLEGKMLLQVSGPHSHGEIWYIHNGKRWYGGTEDSMFEIMKARSLGAKSDDIRKIEVGEVESEE